MKNIFALSKTFYNTCRDKCNNFCNNSMDWFLHFLKGKGIYLVGIVLFVLIMLVRYFLVPNPSHDLVTFIFNWIDKLREEGGFGALKNNIGDYTSSYMTLLALVSYLPSGELVSEYGKYVYHINDMYYVKTISFLFEISTAFAFYKIAKLYNKDNKFLCFVAFFAPLLLITGIANSALWGQADMTYVSFICWSLYFILKSKSGLALLMYGFAFSFKLQALFFLPVIGYLWFMKKVKLRDFFFFFLALFITFLPTYFAGGSFITPFIPFGKQFGQYPKMNYSSGSLYAFFNDIWTTSDNLEATHGLFANMGIALTIFVTIFTIYFFYMKKIEANKDNILLITALYSCLIPYIMPHMHERYFFLADVMILLYCLLTKKKTYLIIVSQLASLMAISWYIFGSTFFPNLGSGNYRLASMLNLFVIYSLFSLLYKTNKDTNKITDEKLETN